MPLNAEERGLVTSYAIQGEIVLRQRGWDKEKRGLFLKRKDVQKELAELENLYKDREGMAERARFLHLMEFQKMLPVAIDTVRRQLLAGREVNGQIIEPPREDSYDAALEVLNRCGVEAGKSTDHDAFPKIEGDVTINNMNMSSGDAVDGKLFRERLRTKLSAMLHKKTKDAEFTITKKAKKSEQRRLPAPAPRDS